MKNVLRCRVLPLMALVMLCLASGALAVRESHPAEAAWEVVDIASAGPLTDIFIGNNLSCQVAHTGDAEYEMYSPDDQQGDCGTFVLVDGSVYGNASFGSDSELTPVSQSGVTGSGTSGSPYQVVTVADADETGIRVTQTDSYVVGDEFYRTDVRIDNTSDATVAVRVYRAADCYLGGSDEGYGYVDPAGKVAACTENVNNSPAGRVEMWTPITPASHYYEAYYGDVESVVSAGDELPDTCICDTLEDNGAAIDWNLSVGAGGNSTVSSYTTFSPTGTGLPNETPTAATTVPHAAPTPCIGGIVSSRCPKNPPKVNVTPSPTELAATATSAPATVAPPQPTATPPGGGTAGVITGPDTGSGPSGSGVSTGTILIAAVLAIVGLGASTAAFRTSRR